MHRFPAGTGLMNSASCATYLPSVALTLRSRCASCAFPPSATCLIRRKNRTASCGCWAHSTEPAARLPSHDGDLSSPILRAKSRSLTPDAAVNISSKLRRNSLVSDHEDMVLLREKLTRIAVGRHRRQFDAAPGAAQAAIDEEEREEEEERELRRRRSSGAAHEHFKVFPLLPPERPSTPPSSRSRATCCASSSGSSSRWLRQGEEEEGETTRRRRGTTQVWTP